MFTGNGDKNQIEDEKEEVSHFNAKRRNEKKT